MKHLKILFADDDLKYAMILKRFLEAEGYEVFYAGNGRIALEQYPEVKPDLVLLDINMPEVNGYEVARQIREHDRHVLIFFLTDRSDKTDRLEGFKVRANDYLAKPFYPGGTDCPDSGAFRGCGRYGGQRSISVGAYHF